ncbi:MAG: extracellular solute-binding protein [Bifidobacteriaceae bacterium]|jgi:arabinogalactan oligomer/maltooligosaccharide transport system substrate-binding protein|nr:extracellular solute-binding protein [Bifidobacteriaceae bacterium]
MKRFAILAVLSLGLTASLAACGDSKKDDEGGGGSSGGVTNVTLSVWGPQQDQVDASSWLLVQEAAFEKAHPEWKITWKNSVVSEGDAATTVKQDASAAADVYMFANDQLGTLVEVSAIGVVPADTLTQVQEQNNDIIINSVTGTDGNVYGVPFTANTWFMYYDKSVFSEDDVKNLDAMLAKAKVAFPLDNSWYLPAFYMGNGCTLYGPNGDDAAAGVDFAGAKATDVTAYLAGLVANANFVVDTNGAGLAGIQNKTVSAFFSGSWDAEAVQEALGDNFGAAQLPTFTLNGQEVQMKSFAGSKAIAFNPNASNPKAAATFAAFLGSTEAQKSHYELRGIIPTDSSLASDAAVAADPVAIAQIDTVENTSVLQPTIPAMSNYWDPSENFGKALVSKEVTAANAAEKTEAWNTSLNAGS